MAQATIGNMDLKKITLKKLRFKDFRAQTRTIDFDDKCTVIAGPNGSGKSTILDALLWLLYGADANDRVNYDLFDNLREFTYETAIPAEVEAEFVIEGDSTITLKRTAKQKWTRPRNSAEWVKDKSDEYHYYADGLELTASGYKQYVSDNIAPIEKLPLMLNVRHYLNLDWKELRKRFADLVGNISSDSIPGDYSVIQAELKQYGDEGAKKFYSQQLTPLRTQSTELEYKIAAVTDTLPNLSGVDSAETEIVKAKNRIHEIDMEISGLSVANQPLVDKRKSEERQIAFKENSLRLAEQDWDADNARKLKNATSALQEIITYNRQVEVFNASLERRKTSIDEQIIAIEKDIEYSQSEVDRLLALNKANKEKEFAALCPHCHQQLPEHMRADARAAFYDAQNKEREIIVEQGRKMRAVLNERISAKDALVAERESLQPKVLKDTTEAKAAVDAANAKIVPFKESDEYKAAVDEIATLKANLTVVPDVDTTELTNEKAELLAEVERLSSILGLRKTHKAVLAQIETLKEEQKHVNSAINFWGHKLDVLMERERVWASMVRDKANKYLRYSHVEMIELDKSGKKNDICSVSVNGVGIGVVNTAAKVIAGIDIAQAFQKKYGVILPLIIDNAEQINSCNLPEVDGQIVTMYVHEDLNELTIR